MADVVPLLGGSGGGTNIAALIQALLPTLIGTGTTSNTSTNTQGTAISPEINALLQNLFNGVQAGNTGYTKDAAIADSNNIIQGLVKSALDQNMPSVLGGGQAAGLYNDSTRTLLSNDLQSRIAAQAAQAVQQNINNYAQITQGNNQTAAQIGSALAQGNRTQTTNQSTTQQTSPAVGGSARNNLTAGALATIGGTALKNLPWDSIGKLFGGGGGGASLGSGDVFSGISQVVNPGNLLNAGYGFDNGIGGLAPSFGANLDLGGATGNLGQAVNSQYDFGSALGNLGNNVGGAITAGLDTAGSAISDLGSSIGSGLSGAWDWLGDAGSSIGDWFSGFFANGGRVPDGETARKMYERTKGNYADGGRVGRKGGEAYTADALTRPVYDPTMALWEQLAAPSTGDLTGAETTGGTSGSDQPAVMSSEAMLNMLRQQVEQAQANARLAAPDELVNQVKGGISGVRQGAKLGDTIASNETALAAGNAGQAISAAEGLQGAQAALAGGVSGGAAAAGGLGTTVGGADVLGSLAGGTGFLPAYTGTASGIFGGAGTGATLGAEAGTGAIGATTAGTAAGTAAGDIGLGSLGAAAGAITAPLVLKGVVDLLTGGVTEQYQSDVESWQKLAGALKAGNAGTDWLSAGLGIFDPFFNPTRAENQGLSQDQMYDNLIKWISGGGLAATGANTGNAGAPYVAEIGAYLRDNPDAANTANDAAQRIQDFWNDPNNPAVGGGGRGLSLANGGAVSPKPGQPDPKGTKDNIQINVSGGEYIIPKDVVDTLGESFFDNLVDLHHTPVAGKPPTR